jgi:hypothetical protein
MQKAWWKWLRLGAWRPSCPKEWWPCHPCQSMHEYLICVRGNSGLYMVSVLDGHQMYFILFCFCFYEVVTCLSCEHPILSHSMSKRSELITPANSPWTNMSWVVHIYISWILYWILKSIQLGDCQYEKNEVTTGGGCLQKILADHPHHDKSSIRRVNPILTFQFVALWCIFSG